MEITTTQLTEQQSKAWLGMAETKNMVASTLAKEELAAQTILMLPNAPDHQTIDDGKKKIWFNISYTSPIFLIGQVGTYAFLKTTKVKVQ